MTSLGVTCPVCKIGNKLTALAPVVPAEPPETVNGPLAQPSSELTPPHVSFPPLLTPRLRLAPGIDLSNCGLNCVCLINGSAGCIQDTALDLSQDGNGQEVVWECRARAGLIMQGPCPALLESDTLRTSWPTPCSSAITLSGGGGRVI